ncbi:MAG: extracellular solute-binding protein [Nitrososphaeria archaeon]
MSQEPKKVGRRTFLNYAIAVIATGVIVGAATYLAVPKGEVTVTAPGATITTTKTITTTITGTPTGYPTTKEGLENLIKNATERYFNLLKEEAKKSSVNWRQFEGEVKSLNCSIRQGPDNEVYTMMARAFEEISGIHINLEFTPEVQQREKVSVDILSKTGVYHLPMIDNMHLVKYVKAGAMEGLNKYIEDAQLTDKDFFKPEDFYEMVKKGANAPPFGEPGDMYAIPSIFHHCMMYYRKDVFDQYGLSVNDIDTFDALMQTASKLNNPSKGFYGFCSRGMRGEGMNIFTWQVFHRGFGGRWFDEKWRPVFNEPETVEAIQAYVDIMTKYGPPGVENYDFAATLSSAGEGKVAMGLDCDCWSTLLWNPANAKEEVLGKFFAYRVPKGKGGRHAGFFFWSFGVPSGIKSEAEKKATWLWCEFAHSPYGIAAIQASSFVILPSRKSVWDMPGFKELCPPNDYIKYKIISQNEDSYYDDRPMIPEWPEVGDIAGIALSSALAKERTAKEAADWAQQEIDKVMRKAGYY